MSRLPKVEKKFSRADLLTVGAGVAVGKVFRSLDMTDGRGRTIPNTCEAVYPFAPCLPFGAKMGELKI